TDTKSKSAPLKLPKGDFDAIQVRVRFAEDGTADGGLLWDNYARLAWVGKGGSFFAVSHGGPGKAYENDFELGVEKSTTHVLGLFIQDGEYVVMYNDRDLFRVKTGRTRLEALSINAYRGKVWFDEIWLRKKQAPADR
ncbi:MAG TPA: hypothetical protein VK661_08055, partial [Planctomycetota bacterium]|nr:hypothetical protein [Planctomycetota bacterium]